MSDDDRDIDIESDEGDDSDSRSQPRQSSSQYYSQAEKRAHHNALERKRRDHIKDSFSSLRDSVPSLHGEKVASRAQILKKAAEYIQFMRKKNNAHQQDIEDLKRQNSLLESQIIPGFHDATVARKRGNSYDGQSALVFSREFHASVASWKPVRTLEKARTTGNFAVDGNDSKDVSFPHETESDTSDAETAVQTRRPKKLKVSGHH